MAGGSIVNTWTTGASRPGTLLILSNPPVASLALPVANTAGNWLFAIVSWRQDAATTGILQYPSSASVCDDAHNWWLPVTVVQPNTGILRTSVWMAPAARKAGFVFASPTAYQQAITVTVLEVTATVPWYSVAAFASTSVNQGTSVTLSQAPPTGLFSIGVISYDNNSATVTFTSSGWLTWNTNTTFNGTDATGDLTQTTFVATTTGSTMTLAASNTGPKVDYSEVLIAVHGVSDVITSPYQLSLRNWPALITEMACGQVLNSNYTFASGLVSPWTAQSSATLSTSSLYTFGASAFSLVITPSGSNPGAGAASEEVTGIVPYTAYTLSAQITVPSGWSGGAQAGFNWYTSGGSFISSSFPSAVTVTGSQQQLTYTAFAPATAGRAQMAVQLTGGTPAATVLTYVGYASLAVPGSYGGTAPDQIAWTDLSSRNITLESMKIGRGIQYEQNALEAGTADILLADNDGYLTPGNTASPYYPYAGDDDVPVRVRAVLPSSPTPYSVLFSGFTDDVRLGWDETTRYGYALVTASDCWSRLTAQMTTALQQELAADSPYGVWPLNDTAGSLSAHNVILGSSAGPWAVTASADGEGTGVVQAFGSTALALPGDSGATGWSLSGLTSADGSNGATLTFLPASPGSLPAITAGVTISFWAVIGAAGSINWSPVIAACIYGKGLVWQLALNNPTGGNPGNIVFAAYDRITGSATSTTVVTGNNFSSTFYFTVQFTQTSWTVSAISFGPPSNPGSVTAGGPANFPPVYDGFCLNGLNQPYGGPSGLIGNCLNGTLQDIAVYPFLLPPARITAHFFTGAYATYGTTQSFGTGAAQGPTFGDSDVQRVAEIIGYGGFTAMPVASRCLDIASPTGSTQITTPAGVGVDWVTSITDTLGQVASSYLTNIASSTLAAMFVDGTGSLVYRRRAEWYDMAAKWVLGESAAAALNANSVFVSGTSPWTGANAATLSQVSQTFLPGYGGLALQFTGNGSTANPQAISDQVAVVLGGTYAALALVYSPQGWTQVQIGINWYTSGHSFIVTSQGVQQNVAAASVTLLYVTGRAPATAAFGQIVIQMTGTPASIVQVQAGYAALTVSPGEAPYLVSVELANDRANVYNVAILTQSGTGTQAIFRGPDIIFSPTSGVTVTAQNAASVAARGAIPYQTTAYIANTLQNPGLFLPADGALEDLANWIVNTQGAPSLRASQVTITPAATAAATVTGLQAEIGDTVTFNRRPQGAPQISSIAYISNIDQEIDISRGVWETTYQLSPAPDVRVLACDNASYGTLTGGNRVGW